MELSISTAATWFLFNAIACLLMFVAEQFDRLGSRIQPRHSIIPGTYQRFIYFEDFSTHTWGDPIGMGLVWAGFGHLVGRLGAGEWVAFGIIAGIVAPLWFLRACTRPSHTPDWGFPARGKVSLGGVVHLWTHFGPCIGMVALGFWEWIFGAFSGWPLLIWLIGIVVWIVAWRRDQQSGRFDPIRPA